MSTGIDFHGDIFIPAENVANFTNEEACKQTAAFLVVSFMGRRRVDRDALRGFVDQLTTREFILMETTCTQVRPTNGRPFVEFINSENGNLLGFIQTEQRRMMLDGNIIRAYFYQYVTTALMNARNAV